MMQRAFFETYHVGLDHRIEVDVPVEFGAQVKLIILPDNDVSTRSDKEVNILSEDEAFLVSAYSAVIEDDLEEDKVWSRYLHAG